MNASRGIRSSAERTKLMHDELDAIAVEAELATVDNEEMRAAILDALELFDEAERGTASASENYTNRALGSAAKEMALRLQQLHRVGTSGPHRRPDPSTVWHEGDEVES